MAESISGQTYDTLKHQVQQLKLEHQSLAAHRAKAKEVETAALLKQKLVYEDQLHSLKQDISSLQQRLKESVERASRVRQHAEREQRVLSQQVDKLQQSLDAAQGEHEQQLAAAQANHMQQLQDIKAKLEDRQQQWEAEKVQLQQQQTTFMSEVEEWSQGEVEAIQAAAAARLSQEQQKVQHWKSEVAALQLQLDATHQHNRELEQQLEQKARAYVDSCSTAREQAAAIALLQQQLQASEAKLLDQAQQRGQEQQQWQQQLQAARQATQARESELRVQQAAELDALHYRLQEVLARKDATISQLRADLDCTLARLQQATHDLMGDDDC